MTGKHLDEGIERVLAGLRDAEPVPGMAERVLHRLEAKPERRASFPFLRRWASWTAAGLALGVAMIVVLQHRAIPHRETTEASLQTQMAIGQRPAAKATVLPGAGEEGHARGPLTLQTAVVHGRTAHGIADTPTMPPDRDAATTVVSYPAPPMPLTRQERLLLGMLRSHEATELIATAGPQAEREVRFQQRAEFSEFFQPPVAPGTKAMRDTGLEDGAAGNVAR